MATMYSQTSQKDKQQIGVFADGRVLALVSIKQMIGKREPRHNLLLVQFCYWLRVTRTRRKISPWPFTVPDTVDYYNH